MDQHPIQGGVEILLVASCYRNLDKNQPDGSFSSYADFTYLYLYLYPHHCSNAKQSDYLE